RQDHGERKAWAAPETTSGVSDVSHDIFYKGHRASLRQLVLDLSDAAKLASRRVEGLARIHPIANEARLEHVQMFAEFVICFAAIDHRSPVRDVAPFHIRATARARRWP